MTNATGQTIQPHEWYQEQLGAYALDALLPEERAALEEHLAGCPTCRAELAQLRLGVKAFAIAAEEREPSPELRNRVWEAIWAEPNFNRADTVVAEQPAWPVPSPAPTPIPIAEARAARETREAPVWMAVAAALAVVLIGSLLAWNYSLRTDRSDLEATVVALEEEATIVAQVNQGQTVGQLSSQDPSVPAGGEVQYLPERQVMLIELHDLPPLPEGQVYQLWLIVDNRANPSEVFVPSQTPGQPTQIWVTADPAQLDALAITREPSRLGSLAPTSAPILAGEI